MRKRPAKKVKRSNKKNHNNLKPILFFILGIIAVIVTVYFITSQMVNTRSRAQTASKGWLSGASGISKTWQDFGTWRGSPVTIAGVWSDATAEDQENQWAYIDYKDFPESLDLSVGAIYGSETFADIASGKLDTRLKKTLSLVDANWGTKKIVFLRFAHEFNGNWYKWSVTSSNVEDYKKAFQHFHALVQSELVAKGRNAKVVWSPNDSNHSDIPIQQMWPGDQYVDIIGVDSYDWDPKRTESNWDTVANENNADGSPRGVEAWRKFAESHGKPMSFPEWGCDPKVVTDNPFYIQKMNEFFRKHAGTGPGQVWYEIYFNEWDPSKIGATSNIPQAAAAYKGLKWGDGGTATQPSGSVPPSGAVSAAPSQPQSPITPPYVCGGSQYCAPSTSPAPSYSATQPSPYITGDIEPSDTMTYPSESPDGNDYGNDENEYNNDSNNDGESNGKHRSREGGSLFELLLELFRKIIEFLMSLFGR